MAEPPRSLTGFLLHGTWVATPYGGRMPPGPDGPALVLPDGRSGPDLLRAVAAARASAPRPDALTLVGYGASGVAVLSLALHQRRLGIGLGHAVCIGASGEDDPVSGAPLAPPAGPRTATRVTLVPGTDPDSADWTARTAAAWAAAGWPVAVRRPGQWTWRSMPSQ